MHSSLLAPAQIALVHAEREALARLLGALEGWDASPADVYRLREAMEGLDELFLLVVTGEFNAGKSAFINALLGGRWLEEGVTPTTHQVQVLVYGDAVPPMKADAGYWKRSLPVGLLREMHIVDTPGTNAILREHEALTRDFVPRADLVLFVTSADRPFTESERSFLESIRGWGKKIVFVINKIDLLEGGERAQVVEFVSQGAAKVMGEPPILFTLSARQALKAMGGTVDTTSHTSARFAPTPVDVAPTPLDVAPASAASTAIPPTIRPSAPETDETPPETDDTAPEMDELPASSADAPPSSELPFPLAGHVPPSTTDAHSPRPAALTARDEPALEAAGWSRFERWLVETLTAGERLRLKLENPLGVARRISMDARREADQRLAVLAADRAALDAVARILEAYRVDMQAQFEFRLDAIDNHVLRLRERGEAFLEEHYRLTNLRSLMNSQGIRSAFETEVVGDTPQRITEDVDAVVDWIVDREHAQWLAVRRQLMERSNTPSLRDAAEANRTGFAARRQALLGSVGRQADSAVAGFNPSTESARLVADIQDTFAQAGLVEVGAFGLGVVLTVALHSLLADVTGILAAGVIAALGLTIIPFRRRQAATALRERTGALRDDLRGRLLHAFERELAQSCEGMTATVAPYQRFVAVEGEQLTGILKSLDDVDNELDRLREAISHA